MQVHLIDGTWELFRAFFGAPPSQSPAGMEVGAVRTMLQSFANYVRRDEVTHIGVAFDTVVESFRNELYDGYKTGEGIDPLLHAQFPLAERALRALGVTVWSMHEFEADDGIASAAVRYAKDPRVDRVLQCSPDKDLTQCVDGRKIVCFDRREGKMLDEDGVVAKFGVPPRAIPDYLALVGDAADGIPGVPKWGAKSTATVLARYGALDSIPTDADDWDIKVRGAKGLAQSLADNMQDALLFRQLTRLRLDVPIAESLDEIEWRGFADQELAALCAELGISRVPRS